MPSISARLPRGGHSWQVRIHQGERRPVAFLAWANADGIEAFSIDVLDQGEAMDLLEAARIAVEGLRAAEADRGRLPMGE